MITLGCITFFTSNRKRIKHSDPLLAEKAEYVRVKFEDQKNGEKSEFRSQRRTNDNSLCPVIRFVRVVKRIRKFIPRYNKHTPLCSIRDTELKAKRINQDYTKRLLRKACKLGGGQKVFGFHPSQIGNKSIRSGAAMALFLKGHTAEKIMLLGRWKSTCFLDYIQPQVVEWVNLFSIDMISIENFFELFTTKETRKTEHNNKDFEIPNIQADYERRNGRLRSSVFNSQLSLGHGSHTLIACA